MAVRIERKIPPCITMNGITYFVKSCDDELTANSSVTMANMEEQYIAVKSTLPFDRQCSYLCKEFMRQMFIYMEYRGSANRQAANTLGIALYQLLKSNDFMWVRNLNDSIPTQLHIVGHTYAITLDRDEHLCDRGLSGEINYNTLSIAIDSGMKQEITRQVICHEVMHGLVFESGLPDRYQNERMIQVLGLLLYMLLRDNDFNFMRG